MMRRASALRRQRGLSIIELLVGAALGLLVVAAALSLTAGQSREQRRQAIAQRLLQDLRAAADIAARDLRRAGHWADAGAGVGGGAANPYAAWTADASSAAYAYSRDGTENGAVDGNEQFGLRLRDGVLQLRLGDGGWQALTDAGTLRVTALALQWQTQAVPLGMHCPLVCSAPGCAPQLLQRRLALRIVARAVADPGIERTLRHEIRPRNDLPGGACPA